MIYSVSAAVSGNHSNSSMIWREARTSLNKNFYLLSFCAMLLVFLGIMSCLICISFHFVVLHVHASCFVILCVQNDTKPTDNV